MKKGLLFIPILFILSMLIWFSCNPFTDQTHQTTRFNVLDNNDLVRSTAGTITFAAVSDTGNNDSGDKEQEDVANLIAGWSPDFIIHAGDVNQGDSDDYDYECGENYYSYIGNYKGSYGTGATVNKFFSALGNHDSTSKYTNFFTLPGVNGNTSGNERYYDFEQDFIHVFVINSNSSEPDGRSESSTQAAWLQEQLAASTATWNIVTFHHGAYCSGSSHGSSSTMQWPFEEWGTDAIFSGHNHVYERVLKDENNDNVSLPYFTVGLGGYDTDSWGSAISGSKAKYNSNAGALLVEATESSITFTFYSISGTQVDTYSLTK